MREQEGRGEAADSWACVTVQGRMRCERVAKRVEEIVELNDMLPATAGPEPTFYNNADGQVDKVVLEMRSVDTGVGWHLDLTPEGNHLKTRGYRMREGKR